MENIESFKINHLKLESGLYVSRIDNKGQETVTTFDLRFKKPNREPVMEISAMHTIEHLGATYLRNSALAKEIVYFGPMGCRTGFYLLIFGKLTPNDIYNLILETCDFIINFNGEIFGATPIECGNYSDQNLELAKEYVLEYKNRLVKDKNFIYPKD